MHVSSGTSPPYGNLNATIEGNKVSVTGGGVGDQCAGIGVGSIFDSGTSTARIAGNSVNAIGCGQGSGIAVYNGQVETMTADIIGNLVNATNTNAGIMLRNFQQAPNSHLIVRAINNIVTGRRTGRLGGIGASQDSRDGETDFERVWLPTGLAGGGGKDGARAGGIAVRGVGVTGVAKKCFFGIVTGRSALAFALAWTF